MDIKFSDILSKLDYFQMHDRYAMTVCPFHDDHSPSMAVFKDGGFQCFACGARGGFAKLMKKLDGWTAPTVVEYKGARHRSVLPSDKDQLHAVTLDAHRTLISLQDPLAIYLKKRGMYGRIEPQRLGYTDGWYTVPIYGERHEFVGAVARSSPQVQERTGSRYDVPFGQPPLLYVPDWDMLRNGSFVAVAFGMFDALSLVELGIPACTPTNGQLSIKPQMLEDIRKKIIIVPDKGEHEQALKLEQELGWRGKALILNYPAGLKDPNDLLVNGHGTWLKEQIELAL